MLRDVFYYGAKPNAHPRERFAKNLNDARSMATTDHFWIINEFCDYTNFEWDFDFEYLPDEDVWAENHTNVWPSVYQKDSGTWLVANNDSELIIYRNDTSPLKRKNIKNDNWVLLDKIDESKFDFGWHPDPASPPYIYRWGNKFYPVELMGSIEYHVPGATQVKYMKAIAELLPEDDRWEVPEYVDTEGFDFTWRPDPREPALIYDFGTLWHKSGGPRYVCPDATNVKYIEGMPAKLLPRPNDPCWEKVDGIELQHFDYTWYPDQNDNPYIYVFGNQYYKPEIMPTMKYVVPDATEIKYVHDCWGTLASNFDKWEIPSNTDVNSFDFSWVPNPFDPPYIYQFGTQWQKTGGPRYVVEGATEVKYIDFQKAKALPDLSSWIIPDNIDQDSFDFSWHPDTTEEGYIYQFGTQWGKEGGPAYVTPDATIKKYVPDLVAKAKIDFTRWQIPEDIDLDSFDFSWQPDTDDKPYVYEFGTQHQKSGGPRYIAKGADEYSPIKFVDVLKATKLPNKSKFEIADETVEIEDFDYSWHPDASDPPYVYVFGNQHYTAEMMPTVIYRVTGALHNKFINNVKATLAQNKSKWDIPQGIDDSEFDYSWIPNPKDPPYIYVTGTQHQKTGGPKYVVEGATDVKYINKKVKSLPDPSKFETIADVLIESFDYSWHPDDTEDPYIYQFGNNLYDAEMMPTIQYKVDGATFTKYNNFVKAKLAPNKESWQIPDNIDDTGFDYSWVPNPKDPPYIYVSGTQHQKSGGPRYVVENATEFKYIDQKVKRLEDKSKFEVIGDVEVIDFDYTWHPDETDPPYNYQFGNQHHNAEIMPTLQYKVEGATHIKYINTKKATIGASKKNWEIPSNIDDTGFDYSWVPNPHEDPYIYQFGTQWQKTGGPRYVVPGATETKYISKKVRKLEDKSNFEVVGDLLIEDFDYSWHPDSSDPPYIYVFGNQHHNVEVMPTLQYKVEGAIHIKYMKHPVVKLAQDRRNWSVPKNIDVSDFDFSWRPDPHDPPFIYRFGTQWQKTGGPSYAVGNASEVKYMQGSKAKALPNAKDPRWKIPEDIDVSDFDFSWHPDTTERPFIYQFGTQWQKTDGPQFAMPGATTIKYVEGTRAKILPKGDNWDIPDGLDLDTFDFSWHPDNTVETPYIYQFGTQWQKTGGPRYVAPGATEESKIVYVSRDVQKAIILPNKKNWEVPENIDPTSIDYSWHPDSTEEPYIYEFATVWNDRGGPKYVVPGAKHYKYIDFIKAKTLPNKESWDFLIPILEDKFDFTWVPHPNDPPYIYVFGNQWNKAEVEPTVEYMVPGATEIKYVHNIVAQVAPDKRRWTLLHDIVEEEFDFSWRPNPKDPPYVYAFGNQHYNAEQMPTILYKIEGATDYKYISDIKAKLKPKLENWQELVPVDKFKFDYSWVPDPGDPSYIYVFGNKWNKAEVEATLRYVVPGATEIKYIQDVIVPTLPEMDKWVIPDYIDTDSFDFTWRPDPLSPPYIYEFATVWNNRGGPKYITPGAQDNKYVENIQAKTKPNRKNWVIPEGIDVEDFDFSWLPHPEAPPYIYQFGTLIDDNDGPRYVTPNNSGEIVRLQRVFRGNDYKEESTESAEQKVTKHVIETTLVDLINKYPNEVFWAVRDNIDYTKFDFNWRPEIEKARYVHVFGSPESEITQTYFVSAPMYLQGYTDYDYVEKDKEASEEYLASLFKPSDMFFVDRGNPEAQSRFESLKEKYPNIQKTRFLNSWVDTISRCINRSNTDLCWILNSELDYSSFNFNYYPNQWQLEMVHVFGTQWNHWGTTFMVNKLTFAEDTKYVKIIEHLTNLNFVKDRRARATNNLYDIYLIDHGNDNVEEVKNKLLEKSSGKSVNVVKYEKSYLNTIKNLTDSITAKKEHHIWVCSSICDYTDFDFSYIVDPFSKDNLHVFPSNAQKFGDTFFIDVNMTKDIIDNLEKLQSYPKVNYNQALKTTRLPAPVFKVDTDTFVGSLDVEFNYPYAIFKTEEVSVADQEHISLWDDESKNIVVTTTGASRIIVPKEAKSIVQNELYDYPYIKTASKLSKSKPLDIVFLSNGELCADENYEHLLAVTKGLGNRVVRVDGVDGRVQGYHAALEASETPWAFTVFAKLKVNNKFDWGWQPDRLQIPKHYIFNAKNPVNGLTYGHQAMIAYNKKLTLANTGKGLDFTLDDPHESVDLLSGVATFNTDPYSTWRTAFREVIKLKSDYSEIAEERLNTWLSVAEGEFAENCLQGANDAVEFYDSVMGDIEELKKSYEWAWLREFYKKKHK